MRIAVDARELCHRPTGVGRYLTELLEEWSRLPQAQRHDWTLYAHARPHVPDAWRNRVRILAGNGGSLWEQWTLTRALSDTPADVLFAPGYSAPLAAPVATVLTVHDVSFCAHPEWFSMREGARRRVLTRWSARRARIVLTDSAFSQREIVRHLGVPELRVRVIPLGVRSRPAPASHREPIVLFAGSVFERRRVDWLIERFGRVVDRVPGARLEIVGENRTARPRIDLELARARSGHPDSVTIRAYVDEATLRDLYGRASVFAFLSEYEGFGLTPLEALAAGIPPVLLDTPVAREVCGAAARYVPAGPAADDALADALVDLLTNEASRLDLMRHAGEVLQRYDWHAAASATLAAIEAGPG